MKISLKKLIEIREQNHKLIPLNGKRPVYKEWQNIEATVKDLRDWIRQKFSFGLVCDKLCALDFDDLQYGREWWRKHGPLRCAIQTTPRPGVHIILRSIDGVRNAVKVNGLPYDIRGGGNGYIKLYNFLENYSDTNPDNLDVVQRNWLPTRKPVVSKTITDVSAYISTITSVETQGGSKNLIRAIAKCKSGGLSQTQAMVTILEWNKTKRNTTVVSKGIVPIGYKNL